MKQLFFCLLALVFVSSCSIEKRHYLHGFYVDRPHGTDSPEQQRVAGEPPHSPGIPQVSSNVENAAAVTERDTTTPSTTTTMQPQAPSKTQRILPSPEKIQRLVPFPINAAQDDEEPVTNRLAVWAFCLAILAVVAALTLWIGWGFSFFVLVFAPLALALGLSARSQIKRNPEKYKNKFFATVAIIVGATALLVAAAFSAAVLIALANFQ